MIETCRRSFGRLDILVNCAGIAEPPRSSILRISPEFATLIAAHLGTVFHTCRVAATAMAAQGHGTIINTGSVAFLGDYGGTGYPAGKGAVNSLTLAIAAELKGAGVRANVVCPGARTRLSTGPKYEQHIDDLHRRGLLDETTMRASLDAAPPDSRPRSRVISLVTLLATSPVKPSSSQAFSWADTTGRTRSCSVTATTPTTFRGRSRSYTP